MSDGTVRELALRYLRGELSVDAAAQAIAAAGGLGMGLDTPDQALRKKWEELMGRLLQISLRDQAPSGTGDKPFGAAEFHALQDQVREELEGEQGNTE